MTASNITGGVLRASSTDNIDPYGAILLGVYVLAIATYIIYIWIWRKCSSGGGSLFEVPPTAIAAKFRLAAARGKTGMMEAIRQGYVDKYGAFDVDTVDSIGDRDSALPFTALFAACIESRPESVLWLCENGADVNRVEYKSMHQYTPLHYAAMRGSKACAEILILSGANPRAVTTSGNTAVELAKENGHILEAAYISSFMQGDPNAQRKVEKNRARLETLHDKYLGDQSEQTSRAVKIIRSYLSRANDGVGSKDVLRASHSTVVKILAGLNMVISACYLVWRALFSLSTGWWYFYSMTVWLAEAVGITLSSAFFYSSGFAIDRQDRDLVTMLDSSLYPYVDVIICYNGTGGDESGGARIAGVAQASFTTTGSDKPPLKGGTSLLSRFSKDRKSQGPPPIRIDIPVDENVDTTTGRIQTEDEDSSTAMKKLEATVTSVLNLDYPGTKLRVIVVNNSGDPGVYEMMRVLEFQLKYMGRKAELRCVASGLGSAMVHDCGKRTEYVLVLHHDKIVHPMLLRKSLGHFYERSGGSGGEGRLLWTKKECAGMLQFPRDFWNISREDGLIQASRASNRTQLQGLDGVGACPCWGHGVIVRKDVLVSIAGEGCIDKSYGEISFPTEIKLSMDILSSGYSTMLLNRSMVYSMAPETLHQLYRQQVLFAAESMRILWTDNPLRRVGLSASQSTLLWETCAHHLGAISIVYLALVPVLYILAEASPVTVSRIWEFVVVFAAYFVCNRITLWWAHLDVVDGHIEMWRRVRSAVWMSPWQITAMFSVGLGWVQSIRSKGLGIHIPLFSSGSIRKDHMSNDTDTHAGANVHKETENATEASEYTFSSTSEVFTSIVKYTPLVAPYIAYYCTAVAATTYFVVIAASGAYPVWEIILKLVALSWIYYIAVCCWPPCHSIIPHDTGISGWIIMWFPAAKRRLFSLSSRIKVEGHEATRKVFNKLPRSSKLVAMANGGKIDDLTENVVVAFNPGGRGQPLPRVQGVPSPFAPTIDDASTIFEGRTSSIDLYSPFAMDIGDQAGEPSIRRSLNAQVVTMAPQTAGATLGGVGISTPGGLTTTVILGEPASIRLRQGYSKEDVRNISMDQINAMIGQRSQFSQCGRRSSVRSQLGSQNGSRLLQRNVRKIPRTQSGRSFNMDTLAATAVMGVKLVSGKLFSSMLSGSFDTPFAGVDAPSQAVVGVSSHPTESRVLDKRQNDTVQLGSSMLLSRLNSDVTIATGKVFEYSIENRSNARARGVWMFYLLNILVIALLIAASVL